MNRSRVPVRPSDVARGGAWSRELDVAVSVVTDATVLARDIQGQIRGEAFLKPDQSPVTIADFAVQAVVADRLARELPADTLVAEEDATSLRARDGEPIVASILTWIRRFVPDADADRALAAIDRGVGSPGDRFWTLDPIDGTEGFIRDGQYVVALALVVRGQVEVGVLGCPRLSLTSGDEGIADAEVRHAGSIAFAMRGHGSFAAPLVATGECSPLRVSAVREPHVARVLRSRAGHHIDLAAFNEVIRELGVKVAPILMDSQAKHTVLAAGHADLLLRIPARSDYRDKIWDHAAGALILEEAGGRVTDLRGDPLDFRAGRTLVRNQGVIASNGHVHDAVVDAIRRLGIVDG